MKKEKELNKLFQPFLNEEYVDEIPNNRVNLIDEIKFMAKEYDLYDAIIEIINDNKGKSFSEIVNAIFDELVEPVEIVDDDELSEDERVV